MPQSLAAAYLHLIFGTKNREPRLLERIRHELNAYIAGILDQIGAPAIKIGCVGDHLHALFRMSRTLTIAGVVEDVKTGSSKWLKQQGDEFKEFHWQSGYGIFSVSQSKVPEVSLYVERQEEHHRCKSFQEEYREFLIRHEIDFDERYVWD